MTIPVAQSVCDSAVKFFRDRTTPPTSSPRPVRKSMATRSSGGTRLLSKEYLMKNATPRNSAKPPTQAKPLTPMNCSQLMAGSGFGNGGGGVVALGGMGGMAGSD